MSRAYLLCFVALAGCSSCSDEPAVPFGLDSGRGTAPPVVAPVARAALVSRELPDGSARAELEGAALDALPGESIRAIAAFDLDGDADRDAIAVTGGDPLRGPRLLMTLRDGAAFAAPVELSVAPVLPGCTVSRVSAGTLGDEASPLVVADVDAACTADESGATRVRVAFVLATGTHPRLLERFVLRARERDGASDSMTLRAEDRDSDGHADLVVALSILAEHGEPADVSLAFLDRPAGLARDPAEPETRIAALSNEARTSLRRHADRALASASRAIALWDAVCRETGRARFETGAGAGVQCARSAGAGRALAMFVQAAARSNDPIAALDASSRLSSPTVTVRDADRDAARAAIESIAPADFAVHEGPVAIVPAGDPPRLSALAFLDESRLLLRGAGARVVDVASGTELPAEAGQSSVLLADPAAEHRVVAIERRCEGTVLVLGNVDEVAALAGTTQTSTALLATRRAPAGVPCPDMTPALRADDDGWRALGWAPQGVLVARGLELRLVPLDLSAQAAGAPIVIEPGGVIPAPIAPGHATREGRAWAYVASAGIVLVELEPARRMTFLRPAGWIAPDGLSMDVAVSPSARRIAWIAGGHVRWLDRDGSDHPPPGEQATQAP